jgi:hypothetical protein
MPEQPATSEQQLDWLTFNLLAGTVVLETRVADAFIDAEQLLRDVRAVNARLNTED